MVKYSRFDVLLISLDPTQGAEIQKTRPCIVISPSEMNDNFRTLIIAPMTSQIRNYPTRIAIQFNSTSGEVILDQIRTIDKARIIKKLGLIDQKSSKKIINTLIEMFS